MSELQTSLLLIGAVVVVAVYLFNWFQERRLRRRLEEAFGDEHRDVLLEEAAGERGGRIEPQLDSPRGEVVAVPATPPAPPLDVAGIDDAIDCVATIHGAKPLDQETVSSLLACVATCGKAWRAAGYNTASRRWEEVGRTAGGGYAELRLALQLVNRTGPLSAVQLSAFRDAITNAAQKASAIAECPDIEATLQKACELDSFCADVDVAIGVNVIAAEDGEFGATRIRALAEAAGFKLEPDGMFHLEDEAGNTVLTLGNQGDAPFLPEQIGGMTTRGVTLLLDVPRVADIGAALERMFEIGKSLTVTLKGRLVDDNRAALSSSSMDKIRQQLAGVHGAMNARGIAPGSTRALRLFS
jgi:FtsZ-interacting cell division protein ZipA